MTRTADILVWIGTSIGKPPGFERFVRFLMPPEKCAGTPEICLLRDGSLFLTRPSVSLGWYVTFFGTYEAELRDIFRAILLPGAVAIDIGANVGWHSLLMARLVGMHGRVLSVEPNPSVRNQLVRNVRINRLDHVEIIPCVLGESERILKFFGPDADDPRSGDGHVASPEEETQELLSLEARSLDAIATEARVERLDLIKIDVEGYEWPVLQGGEKTIARLRPYIVFEFDRAYTSRGGGTPELFAEFFSRHGYRLFTVERSWAQAVRLSNWPDCANLFAIPTS